MARIRTIKPEFWTNEKLSACSECSHLLAAALLNYADDEGYFNANPILIKAACSPLREPSVSIHGALTELHDIGYLRLGVGTDGRQYGKIVGFSQHQRINRPSKSKIRELSVTWCNSLNTHGGLTEDSLRDQGSGIRDQGMEQGTGSAPEGSVKSGRFDPSTVQNLSVDAFERYRQYRREQKFKALGTMGCAALARKMAAYSPIVQLAMVDQTIANGWQGVFALKGSGASGNGSTPPGYKSPTETSDERVARLRSEGVSEEEIWR